MAGNQIRIALFLLVSFILVGSARSAGAYSYASSTSISPLGAQVAPGGTVQLTATVQSGCPPFEMCTPLTGTVTWDDGDVGGSFSNPSCTFKASDNLSVGMCVTLYTAPRVPGVVVVAASYSGSAAFSTSTGNSSLQVGSANSSTSTSTVSASTQTVGGGFPFEYLSLAAVGVVALAGLLVFASRRRKPL